MTRPPLVLSLFWWCHQQQQRRKPLLHQSPPARVQADIDNVQVAALQQLQLHNTTTATGFGSAQHKSSAVIFAHCQSPLLLQLVHSFLPCIARRNSSMILDYYLCTFLSHSHSPHSQSQSQSHTHYRHLSNFQQHQQHQPPILSSQKKARSTSANVVSKLHQICKTEKQRR